MTLALGAKALPASVDRTLCDEDAVAQLVTTDGDVRCTVFDHPVYPKMAEHPHRRYEGINYSRKAYVVAFANIDCWDYREGSQRALTSGKLREIFASFGATSETVGDYNES